jgi:hypothetical protein
MKLTRENRSTRRNTCPSATLSTTNPTWTGPGNDPSYLSYIAKARAAWQCDQYYCVNNIIGSNVMARLRHRRVRSRGSILGYRISFLMGVISSFLVGKVLLLSVCYSLPN